MTKRTVRAFSIFGALIGMIGVVSIAAQAAQPAPTIDRPDKEDKEKKVELNEEVPDFKLMDLEGKEHRLSEYKDKIVVLEWINPQCPYVQQCYKAEIMHDVHKQMKSMFGKDNVAFLAINSTANTSKDNVKKIQKAFNKQHDIERPVLLDYDGKVGKMFGARTTPHMYVIDNERILRYHGALSDDKWSRKSEEDRTNYVLNALKKLNAEETVAPDYVKPWGCSVKYAKKD